jgi:hypothetical protein
MRDEEMDFEIEEGTAGEEVSEAEEGTENGEDTAGEERPAGKDAREAVRLNKAPWINRKLIFMTLAGIAAVTMLISIIGPGKGRGKKKGEGVRNAPEVTAPDFGDYWNRASYPAAESPPEEEMPPPIPPPYPPPLP